MIKKIIILLIIIGSSFSQVLSDYSFNSAESCSMAGAIVSNKGGNSSLYNNPATLVDIEKNKISIGSSNIYSLKYLPLRNMGAILKKESIILGLKYSSLSTEINNQKLSEEKIIGVVTAFNLLKDNNSTLSIGFSTNYYMVDYGPSAGASGDGSDGVINSESIGSLGIDVGFLASLREKNRLGVYIKNINSPSIGRTNEYLPRKIDIGISTIPNDYLIVTFSTEQLLGYDSPHYRTSIQYKLNKAISLNSGIQINPNRFGCGFNIEYRNISIQYGYLTHLVMPETHHFNIGFNF